MHRAEFKGARIIKEGNGNYYLYLKLITTKEKLAKIKIKIACDFDKDGYCVAKKNDECSIGGNGGLCCCAECGPNCGYLRKILSVDVTRYSRLFNRHKGFFRPKKGCILPRRLRSTTCLGYVCSHLMDNNPPSKNGLKVLDAIREMDL